MHIASDNLRGDVRGYSGLSEFDATKLIALGYRTIEIRTAYTPPVTIDLLAPADPRTAALLNKVKPAIIFRGLLGEMTIAPYGVPSEGGGEITQMAVYVGLGLGATILGVMLLGGTVFKR